MRILATAITLALLVAAPADAHKRHRHHHHAVHHHKIHRARKVGSAPVKSSSALAYVPTPDPAPVEEWCQDELGEPLPCDRQSFEIREKEEAEWDWPEWYANCLEEGQELSWCKEVREEGEEEEARARAQK